MLLNRLKDVKAPYSSMVSWDFLGVLILGRAVCDMVRFHGMLMYLGHMSLKKNGEYKQIEAMCTRTASIHRIPITGYMKTP
jgi:hypothetical protein